MEDLLLIASLLLLIPVFVGIGAMVLSARQRKTPRLRVPAIILTAVTGVSALGLVVISQGSPIYWAPAIQTVIAVVFLFVPKSQTGSSLKD